ncbi:hypothetical protein LTS10_010073 [Elasticomyces elasticus]|nr:hypothetical protein LTS10_010073 [Elasticomyces elasticus]
MSANNNSEDVLVFPLFQLPAELWALIGKFALEDTIRSSSDSARNMLNMSPVEINESKSQSDQQEVCA